MVKKRIVKRRHRAVRPPFSVIGGKVRMLPRLLMLLPKHRYYIEVFGGTGALLLAKQRSHMEVYNDMNSGFVDMYRIIRDTGTFTQFKQMINWVPYSKEEWEQSKNWNNLPRGSIERAVAFFAFMSMGFYGRQETGTFFARGLSKGTVSPRVYANALSRLSQIHQRFQGVLIDHERFEKIIPRYDRPEALFYCDPPYIPTVRKTMGNYKFEMTIKEHKLLIEMLLACKGKVMLSGYANKTYNQLEQKGFERYDFAHTASGKGGLYKKRMESVWINF